MIICGLANQKAFSLSPLNGQLSNNLVSVTADNTSCRKQRDHQSGYKAHRLLSSIEEPFQGQWHFWALPEPWHMKGLPPIPPFGNCEVSGSSTEFNTLSSTDPNVLHATFVSQSTYCTKRLTWLLRKESLLIQLPLDNRGKKRQYSTV